MKSTIQGYSFELNEPYSEGHTLTALEAIALNKLRSENICNNMRSKVQEHIDNAGEEGLTDEQHKAIQAELDEYDKIYAFGAGRSVSRDPLITVATNIAKAIVDDEIKSQGMTVKAYKELKGDDKYKKLVAEVSQRETIIERAKQNLEENKKQKVKI